jgi:hypothetical protein
VKEQFAIEVSTAPWAFSVSRVRRGAARPRIQDIVSRTSSSCADRGQCGIETQ